MTPPPRRRSTDTEAEATVPYADPLDALHAKMDYLIDCQERTNVILEGRHDENGDHHPGLSHRVKRLENALNWIIGIATAIVTIVLGAFGVSHFK